MASKLAAFSLLISTLIVVITIVIVFVPNLISYKLSISMTEIMALPGKLTSMSGMIPEHTYTVGIIEPNIPTTGLPPGIGDYRLCVSLGIWRCDFETVVPAVPMPINWGGSYVSLGDKFETTANQMMSSLDQMGFAKLLFGENAVPAMAGLIRTIFVRVQIEVTVALVFAVVALMITIAVMCGKIGQTNPLVVTSTAICYLIQAIMLGVALGSFAQTLQQVTSLAEIYALVKITDRGYGIVVLGFLVVLASISLALTNLRMLAYPAKEPYKRFNQSDDSLAYPAREKFKLNGEYDV
ncbi:uncharacterized protein LOC110453573 [Mizuhopecten yessoensis]|uniref:Uncharacterized protein n=1 Tax=Mizuhopecten yessoensis TaxID=6573 RepID=A0A210QH31_MIZYE|nr:uncharacterized protein LOC110453573 [Mizuhopecten yessoensis]OWF48068.1 hypothetical protein KP79_PYT16312 [Mizuhopecten yessoensis]